MARQRDYKAEYARRVERGRELGLSRSQSRGHPGKGQEHAKVIIERVRSVNPQFAKPNRAPKQQKQPSPKVPSRKNSVAGGRNVIIKGRGKHGKDRQGIAWQGRGEKGLAQKLDELAKTSPERKVWLSVEDVYGSWRVIYSETSVESLVSYSDDYDSIGMWIKQAASDHYGAGDIGLVMFGDDDDGDIPDDFGWEVMALV